MICPVWEVTPGRRRPNSFLTDPDFQFEFFLALQLGMTVQQMRANMSYLEFVQWSRYFAVKAQREELAAKKANRRR